MSLNLSVHKDMAAALKIINELPQTIRPMLARLARRPFDSSNHVFELKWDGIRAIAFIEGRRLRLLNRNGLDITQLFPEISSLPKQLNVDRVVLDGELVLVGDDGEHNSTLLQERLSRNRSRRIRHKSVHFVAFDLLYIDGYSVMGEPLFTRKNMLQNHLVPGEIALVNDFIENDGVAFFQKTCELGLEGIIAKDKSSLYIPGKRSQYWLKVKRVRDCEFVIGGYSFGGTKKEPFTSLLLGLYDNDKRLVFVGQVSSGISKETAKKLTRQLQTLHTDRSPFESERLPGIQRLIFWCKPEMVCQVEYGEFSADGRLVYPVFQASRSDKLPVDCTISDAPGWPILLADFA
jgi:bifunctional non-homologous end joining protein LigD